MATLVEPNSSLAALRNWAISTKAVLARFRVPLLTFAAVLFCAGIIWSIRSLGLQWSHVSLVPVAILAIIIAPLSIAYSAVNMQLMSKAIGTRIGFLQAVQISAYAQIAELLPIPGGAIVRTAALVKSGGKTGNSAGLVLTFALLWICVAIVGCGLALLELGPVAWALIIGGLAAICGLCFWLGKVFGWFIAFAAISLRILGLAIVSARVVAAFAILGIALGGLDALIFAFALIAGSAASIVPAGLGIGESLSALMAAPTNVAPAAAFMAAALGRLIGFAVNMFAAFITSAFPMNAHTSSEHRS
ncbi:MAG: hypothetical protein ABJ242_12145 [Marinomonas sp.]